MFNSKDLPCAFYYYIHCRLYEKHGSKEISMKKARDFLFEWRILKPLRPIIIKELEALGLVKRINKKRLIILKPDMKVEEISKYYGDFALY